MPHHNTLRVSEAYKIESASYWTQAAQIDVLCAAAWYAPPPGYVLIINDGRDWPANALLAGQWHPAARLTCSLPAGGGRFGQAMPTVGGAPKGNAEGCGR